MVGGLISNTTFAFLKAASLFATVSDRPLRPIIGDRVKTGDFAVDIVRPLDIQISYWAMDLGNHLFSIPTRLLPAVTIGALTTGMTMPSAVSAYLPVDRGAGHRGCGPADLHRHRALTGCRQARQARYWGHGRT